MAAPKGNNYWQFAGKYGRDHKYTPATLWEEAQAYFKWVEDHPLYETRGFAYKGDVTKEEFPKMRAMTVSGFCLFADITMSTLGNYEKESEDFLNIITQIKTIIYNQKLEGAAADLLNANIISRELGLADRQINEIEDKRKSTDELFPETDEITHG